MTLSPPSAIPCYPARPVNGGPLPLARSKIGAWVYEPKGNGWRAWVHAPSGCMWGRKGDRLSIAAEFTAALQEIRRIGEILGVEWFDTEALERRHNIGRGTLFILDILTAPVWTWKERSAWLDSILPRLRYDVRPSDDAVYRFDLMPGTLDTWEKLKEVNRVLGVEFYEGLVAKREDSEYPRQMQSASKEFPHWMKHRWRF